MNGKEIRELLAKQRDQKFRKKTEAQIDGIEKMSYYHSNKNLSDEHKKKIGEASRNSPRNFSEESMQNIKNANKGKIVSAETRKKLSESLKGRTYSQEYKDKMAISRGNFTPEQVLEIYNSTERQKDIAERYGVNPSTISLIKNGHKWSSVTGHKKKDKK